MNSVEPWQSPTLLSGWQNYGNGYNVVGYYKDRDRVYLKGLIRNGAVNNVCFILPPGYRPSARELLSTIADSRTARVDIDSAGNVLIWIPSSPGWVSLDGLSFRVQ